MATYYTSSSNNNNQREAVPMIYLRESLPGSYPDGPILPGNVMMYMNPGGSYSDTLAVNSQIDIQSVEASNSASQQQQEMFSNLGASRIGEHDFNAWRDGRNEVLVMHPMVSPPTAGSAGGGGVLQGQGLSLSLGTQIPSGIQMPAVSYRNNPNSVGFASFLNSNSSVASREEQSRNTEFLLQGYPGGGNSDNKGDLTGHGMSSIARTVPNSKYLKAAQQLLDEVVNVRKALKQNNDNNERSQSEQRAKSLKDGDGGSKSGPSETQESASNATTELSHAERQDLQNKLTKLLSMLDEVDRRYKQYYHQMQIVISSFDVIAGCGAAKPYTALALQTISRHFRCLRDAISGQIRATRKSLGEQDTSENGKGVGITRLRYVDQQLRQQKALQQLGMMQQHAWRPQRGLPESSVSILRAWLFEHFLHPYPKDSDKIMLARQTGLTRSQVSNWFINARVRLWKPMVEEMYKEEFAEAEMDSNSSSTDNGTPKVTKADDKITSQDRDEDLQQSGSSVDPKLNHTPDVEMGGGGSSYQNTTRGEPETEYVGFLKQRHQNVNDCNNIFTDMSMVHNSEGANDRFMAAAYHMSELGRFGSGNGSGVSLTLGLQHCEGGSLPMSRGSHQGFIPMRGDEMYNPNVGSSMGPEAEDYECLNNGNRQPRFSSSSHLLHDFVA